ncbi:MAG: DnaA regulatory inactivator Hda [Agarilytica sp.]
MEIETEPMQLSLGVTLKDDATFDNFYCADDKANLVVNGLKAQATGKDLFSHVIWGAPGCGLTHLLQAACHYAHQNKMSVQYLPVREIRGYAAEDICEGLEATQLVCLDGLELICGNPSWETSLFHLFNQLRDRGHSLLMSTHSSPSELDIQLADLKSRILGSVVYQVQNLDDLGKQEALIMRASARGLHMSEDIAKYIMQRSSRNMNDLFMLLNRLDECSLQQQRRLTIPFVKEVLGNKS